MRRLRDRILPLLLAACMMLALVGCGGGNEKETTKPTEERKYRTVSEIIQAYENMADVEVRLVEAYSMSKKIDGKNWNMQGGDNDGQYGYFALNDGGATGSSITRIYKIDLRNWEIKKISGDLQLGHANDVTYVPQTHQLIVTWCENPAENASVVDADTLEIVENIIYPQKHPNMTYSPDRGQYVFASWVDPRNLTVYDEELNFVATIPNSVSTDTYAQQCMACDEDLIYFLYSPAQKGVDKGFIYVHTWDGETLGEISFPLPYEAENISIYGKSMILAVNDHHEASTIRFYQLNFLTP